MQPLISVVMPARETVAFIGAAIESIVGQTWQNWELCIAADPVGDDTLAVAQSWAARDPRIRVEPARISGYAATRNQASDMARGDLVCLMDSDDLSLPGRLMAQAAYLTEHPDIDIVPCLVQRMDATGRVLGPPVGRPMDAEKFWRGEDHGPANATLMVRGEAWRSIGPLSETYSATADSEWYARALLLGLRWGYLAEVHYLYRSHPGQTHIKHPESKRLFQRLVQEMRPAANHA